ncbi:TPA: hypothetical protein DIS57_02135 [Candidatus Wolfebacteria bacterium]|nr:hypothetical protein [Candidatus Wolfebacteria bacterium]
MIPDEQLKQVIKGFVSEEALANAGELAAREKIPLYESIVKMDLMSDRHLGGLVAEFLTIPFVQLSEVAIPKDVLDIVPEAVARKQAVIVFNKNADGLHVAMADPDAIEIIEFIKKKAGLPVVIYFATQRDIENAIALYAKDIRAIFDEIIKENVGKMQGSGSAPGTDLPIIKIVDTIVSYAYQNKASDIHLEPQIKGSVVRFGIDGVLHDVITIPLEMHPQIASRIKILSKLRIDEQQAAQDGKFQFSTSREKLDVRVSVVPVTGGEKIVMRLLSERSRQFSLESLGFSAENLEKTKVAYAKPYGMILSTGPTGSGKTTTMYAILKILNQRGVNISTIEDPVEYEMEGVNQIQVNPKANLTFASGLRSILRQDPNIILVGEIRDEETADIAVGAAMTGHLVLSTVHANDAASAIPRLLDMGVEPYLLASTINVIIAQRLVRKIHAPCQVSEEIPADAIIRLVGADAYTKAFGDKKTAFTYRGKGCNLDYGIGYEGRVGIYEILVINDELREAIISKKDAETLKKIAIKSGMITMMEDALVKVAAGVTTLDELMRATEE